MRRALTIWRALLAIGAAAAAAALCFVASRLARTWSPRVADRFAYRGFACLAKGERAAATAGVGLLGTWFASLARLGVDELARTRAARLHRLLSQGRGGVRRHAAAPLLRRATLAAAIALIGFATATAAMAWWTSTATVSGNVISTGSWADCASLSPGTSKAVHWYTRKKGLFYHVLPIASIDTDGRLSLDFGDVEPRNRNASPDVFEVTGRCDHSISVTFAVEGPAAGLIGSVRFAEDATLTVDPEQTRSVYVKLAVPKSAAGEYGGTLVVSVDGTTERHELPVLITVKTPPPGATWVVLDEASPTPSPATVPEAVLSVSPSPSESSSPLPTASASPSVTLEVLPGSATAERLDPATGVPVEQFLVAVTSADGAFALDLGDIRRGESHVFDGALVLAPIGSADLPLSFHIEGDAATLVDEVSLVDRPDAVLLAGTTAALRLTVTVPADAVAGARVGVLLLTSGDAVLLRLPLTMFVWTTDGATSPSPETSASASPLPSPSGSAD